MPVFYFFHCSGVKFCMIYFQSGTIKLKWLSRDNLSSLSVALVTYMKCFYKIRSEIQGKIK